MITTRNQDKVMGYSERESENVHVNTGGHLLRKTLNISTRRSILKVKAIEVIRGIQEVEKCARTGRLSGHIDTIILLKTDHMED